MLQSSASQSPSVMRARHIERHGGGGALSDVILGGQDGLVNVLGVILGVAAATPDPNIVRSYAVEVCVYNGCAK